MALPQETLKTIADIDALPEGTKAELIDGGLFFDTAPTLTRTQQALQALPFRRISPRRQSSANNTFGEKKCVI